MALDEGTAYAAPLALTAIDLQLLAKVSGSPVTIDKILQGGTTRTQGGTQGLLDGHHQSLPHIMGEGGDLGPGGDAGME